MISAALDWEQYLRPGGKINIDGFAGGGGATSGLEEAGLPIHIAINHDKAAVEMHKVNHPTTKHFCSDIFEIDPRIILQGASIGFAWFSPDCTFHSKARGLKPIRSESRKRRGLAWVICRWTGLPEHQRPEVVALENVEEFAKWGPLCAKRCKNTGRVMRFDKTLAPRGERTPIEDQQLVPNKRKQRRSFLKWIKLCFTNNGYSVNWWELKACDHGAPTIRNRLYLVAHRNAHYSKAVRPAVTHGSPDSPHVASGRLLPYRTTAECIDWKTPMLSIFADKDTAKAFGKRHKRRSPKRPLADATLRRIARGTMRFVVNNPKPYLVLVEGGVPDVGAGFTLGCGGRAGQSPERAVDAPFGTITTKADAAIAVPFIGKHTTGGVGHPMDRPLDTVTANGADNPHPGCSIPLGIVAPMISPITHQGEHRMATPADTPLNTITTASRGEFAVVAPVMTHANFGEKQESSVDEPFRTIVAGGTHHSIVAPVLVPRYSEREGQAPRCRSVEEPLPNVVPTGNGAQIVSAFLAQNNAGFYAGDGRPMDAPVSTILNEGANQSVCAVAVSKFGNGESRTDINEPLQTVCSGGLHHGVIAASLATNNNSREPNYGADEPAHSIVADGARHTVMAAAIERDFGNSVGSDVSEPIGAITGGAGGHAALIAAFLAKFYGTATGQKVDASLDTITTKDRFGLVTITLTRETEIHGPHGTWIVLEAGTYTIIDICMRMLRPRELYRAQGFRDGYVIEYGADGRKFTETEQVRMCGNSVCPDVAKAIAETNAAHLIAYWAVAA